jgi:hypothetical protein
VITEDDKALVATITFFRALRREWLAQNLGRFSPNGRGEGPVPDWQDIGPMERQKFLKSMKAALASASVENVLKVIENAKAL